MNRRLFLAQVASMLALPSVGGYAYATNNTPKSPRFLLIFLRGAYDCNNLLIPHNNDFYYNSRPTIAIQPKDCLNLDGTWSLNAKLKESMYPLFTNGQLSFIPFAGTHNTSRSHFVTQDDIEAGFALNTRKKFNSGFMGRLAKELTKLSTISFTVNLPLIFQGSNTPNIALHQSQLTQFDAYQAQLLTEMYQSTPLSQLVEDGFNLKQEVINQYHQEMMQASRDAIGSTGFEIEASRVAMLMRDKYKLAFLDIGGWDTHINQGAIDGSLSKKLSTLSRGLVNYAQTLGEEWENTVVMVVSEFGRTFRENGNKGTDHGHGTVYWLLGGRINGGKILGEQLEITPESLFQQRDYPVLNHYQVILGQLFKDIWGLSDNAINRIFPNVTLNKTFELV